MVDINWLKTFVAAAKFENFRQTADSLYISQPTVSVHIKLLEEELGVKLFHRIGRNIQLTKEGKKFEQLAHSLLKQYHDSLEDFQTYIQGYTNSLNIAISPLLADTVLPAVLKRYVSEHPSIEINVMVMESRQIEEMLLEGNVDIGISCLPASHRKVHCEELYEDPVKLVVAHDGFDLETGLPFDEEEVLSHHHLLTHCHPIYWEELISQIKNKYPFVKTMKVSEVHITKRFIIEGFGVSYLPESTFRREFLEGRLIDIPSNLDLPKVKVYTQYSFKSDTVLDFVEFINQFQY
jgi:LysR family transcriptional regulator, repressor for citA